MTLIGSDNLFVAAAESSLVGRNVQLVRDMPATAQSVTSTAMIPAGSSVTVEVQSTGKAFPIPNGSFRIPLT